MGNNKSSTNGVQYLNAPDAAGQRQIARWCRRRYRMRHAICQPRHSSAPRRRTAGLRGLLGCGPTRRWPGVRAAYLWRSLGGGRPRGRGGGVSPALAVARAKLLGASPGCGTPRDRRLWPGLTAAPQPSIGPWAVQRRWPSAQRSQEPGEPAPRGQGSGAGALARRPSRRAASRRSTVVVLYPSHVARHAEVESSMARLLPLLLEHLANPLALLLGGHTRVCMAMCMACAWRVHGHGVCMACAWHVHGIARHTQWCMHDTCTCTCDAHARLEREDAWRGGV